MADNILCFAGAEEGIYIAMHALLERSDHALVITPNYQAAETVPQSLCAVSEVPLDPDRVWTLDIDRVAQAIRPNTRPISSVRGPFSPMPECEFAYESLRRVFWQPRQMRL